MFSAVSQKLSLFEIKLLEAFSSNACCFCFTLWAVFILNVLNEVNRSVPSMRIMKPYLRYKISLAHKLLYKIVLGGLQENSAV